ncbi:hypothetical protein Sta7437_0567 [Stanieria cyanosphaera PCC 7437]|uniref:SnoaL-like domain-containing protein n=2 Tax=Stanieria cyanosphaera TaxID=102116 RepID=K9XNR9_STAC7|nr:hypothetical protein Sta7437_0567 [Stanieria cyanosphaera PCC 7437]
MILARIKTIALILKVNKMNQNQKFLQNLYEAFNNREIERIILSMHPNVKWANGMEGGFVYGRNQVRDYWRKQFEMIQPQLKPLNFDIDENDRNLVTVHQIIRDLDGNLLIEKTVQQIFTIENGLISIFEIKDAEPFFKNDN